MKLFDLINLESIKMCIREIISDQIAPLLLFNLQFAMPSEF